MVRTVVTMELTTSRWLIVPPRREQTFWGQYPENDSIFRLAVLFEPNAAANRNESVQGKDARMRSHAHDTVKTEDTGISGGPTTPLYH